MSKLVLLAAVLVVSVFVSGAAEVQAQGSNAITFRVKSLHPNIVDLEFYSQSRRGHVWPGGGQVYTLRDSQSHHHDLACNAGEKVCYGAWVRGGGSEQFVQHVRDRPERLVIELVARRAAFHRARL